MPNIIGYSESEVNTIAKLMNIKITIEGNGYVVNQSIAENEVINQESILNVKLEKKFPT